MATIYIRKSGNDANNGTNATTDAVLTIARADALVSAGDTIDIGAGVWSENVTGNVAITYQGAGMYETEIHLSSVVTFDGNDAPALRDLTYKYPSGTPNAQYALQKVDFDRVYVDFNFCTGILFGAGALTRDQIYKRCIFTNIAASTTFFDSRYSGVLVQVLNCCFIVPSGVTITSFTSQPFDSASYAYNNIFYNVRDQSDSVRWLERIISSGGSRGYNMFNLSTTQVNLEPTEVKGVDPLFEDVAAGNFELQSGSPAINFGVPYAE